MWCVAALDDEYIARMEDILALYEKPLDPREPVVCLDEKPVQLLANTRPSSICEDGVRRTDYEYRRQGTANVFCAVEPRAGRHFVEATSQRTKRHFAKMLKLLAAAYPDADVIHLVVDNLNTHREVSLLETFGPARGAALWQRFRVHYTPKHASWLNQAEIAISMLARECLGRRRLGALRELRRQTGSWRRDATRARRVIDWRFTRRKARAKFKYDPRLRSPG
jgi:transposase